MPIWLDKDLDGQLQITPMETGDHEFVIQQQVGPRKKVEAKVVLVSKSVETLTNWLRCKKPQAVNANQQPETAADILRDARDRIMSLEPKLDDMRVSLRPVARGGFAQARYAARDLLTGMIEELETGQR